MSHRNKSTFLGEAISLQHLLELPKPLKEDMNISMHVYYAGGLRAVVRFDIPKEAGNFLKDEHN